MGTSGSATCRNWWMLAAAADLGLTVGDRDGWEARRFGVGCEPSQPMLRWRRYLVGMEAKGWLLSVDKKIKIIFYNMECEDVLDKKLRVTDRNEIKWHESKWIIRLLSDSNHYLVRSLGSEDALLVLVIFFRIARSWQDRLPIQKDRLVIMMSAVSRITWRHDSWMTRHDWNLKFHDMGIGRVDWNWDGIGQKWRWWRWMLSDRKVEMGF